MDTRLQAYLDGDLTLAQLPAELRAEAEAWDGLLEQVRATSVAGAPLGFDARVLSALEAEHRPAWQRVIGWLLRPRLVAVRPAVALAAATVAVVVLGFLGLRQDGAVADSRVYVQFVVDAPSAETVHVVGDFTEWRPTVELEDEDGDGVWSGRVPLRPGVHEYMFVIDGANWVTDPNAAGYQDDGFGQRNAIVAVTALDGT